MMNLSNGKIVQKIALSALLVSAIASPAAANAEETAAPDAPQTVAAQAAVTVKFEDPAAIAKQYAPDTVSAWTSLLKKYEELAVNFKAVTLDIKAAPTGDGIVPPAGGKALIVQAMKAQDGVSVKLKSGPHITGAGGLKVANKDGMMTLTPAVPIADTLLQSQMDLAKAVESKDEKIIKSALADLFKQYEAEIDKLEQEQSK
ncbi:MAG: hypothetical protein E7E23_00210 [Paenibacillus sp.]|uniref:hypothetical protein n=1 Tax=Paenibacillus sp. TaxID=58172 RepID=UPI00208139A0|nr:hypothetical protein [Paenibacillus sp.]MDU2238969.1 hypothetical protein [Paenibacillus sp.]GJM81256.1 hypothetical protein HMSSN139_37520 [Paenibacillus sp. HMSSN-139]